MHSDRAECLGEASRRSITEEPGKQKAATWRAGGSLKKGVSVEAGSSRRADRLVGAKNEQIGEIRASGLPEAKGLQAHAFQRSTRRVDRL